MNRWVRIGAVVIAAALAVWFAVVNGAVLVPLELGFVSFRAVPLPVIVYGSVLVGMLIVFGAGLRADLRTRRTLRRYRDVLEREE